jgi:integrase
MDGNHRSIRKEGKTNGQKRLEVPISSVFTLSPIMPPIDCRQRLSPHSLRHRAKDRLRAEGCPLDIQYELLGHETKTVASGYGHGSPVPLLRKWIDKVGF